MATPDAQHYLVSFSDDAPATERNSNFAVEKTYDSVIADKALSANFQAKPTLTLTANNGGTLTLDGMTYDTVYNINFYHIGSLEGTRSFTIPASRLPYDTTFSYGSANVMYAEVNETSGKLSISNRGDHTVSIRISGAFGYGSYRCRFEGMDDSDEWVITCTASTVPVPPAGVVSANATLDTFVVDYNTDVTVVAIPDSIHYLATLGEELVNSNDSIHRTFTMTAPVNLPADFRAKPTLTLAQAAPSKPSCLSLLPLPSYPPPTRSPAGNLAMVVLSRRMTYRQNLASWPSIRPQPKPGRAFPHPAMPC